MAKKRNHWPPEEIEILTKRYPHEKTAIIAADLQKPLKNVFRMAETLGLSKTKEYMDSPDAYLFRRKNQFGNNGSRFQKGHRPFHKGDLPGMKATQFKKGHLPHNQKPIGTTRYRKGYLQVKLFLDKGKHNDYVYVHYLVWELHRGAIPYKHYLIFKDSNKENITIENLEAVSYADLLAKNSIHNLPEDLKEIIHLRAAVTRAINRKENP